MIFFLSSNISDALLQTRPSRELINALQHLADSRRCGLNEILGERNVLRAIANCMDLSSSARAVYTKLADVSSQMRHLLSECELYVFITEQPAVCATETVSGQKRILLSAEHIAQHQRLAQNPTLLCENLDDCVFLTCIGSIYKEWKRLPNLVRFDDRHGGGQTTAQVYKAILEARDALCLCISDSDLKYDGDPHLGATAVALQEADAQNGTTLGHLHILQCQECENMIPASILCEVYASDTKKLAACTDVDAIQTSATHQLWKYYDIKNGIRTYELLHPLNPEYRTSWIRAFGGVADVVAGRCSGCFGHENCEDKKQCTVYLGRGLGTTILRDTIDTFFLTRSAAEVRRRVPEVMLPGWMALGRLVWTWGTVGYRMAA